MMNLYTTRKREKRRRENSLDIDIMFGEETKRKIEKILKRKGVVM